MFRFEVGKTYLTLEGKKVTIIGESTTKGYETVEGDDFIWRYNREGEDELGRTTGSALTCPTNLIPVTINLDKVTVEEELEEFFEFPHKIRVGNPDGKADYIDRMARQREARLWCIEHLGRNRIFGPDGRRLVMTKTTMWQREEDQFSFRDHRHAFAFKMRWG